MKFRKLRIAWSVGWGVLCLLLVSLWLRSYWWCDVSSYRLSDGWAVGFRSMAGRATFEVCELRNTAVLWYSGFITEPIVGGVLEALATGTSFHYGKVVKPEATVQAFKVPHWFLVIGTAATALIPWIRQTKWRFCLRTLLIATTLIAVVLGVIVCANRN